MTATEAEKKFNLEPTSWEIRPLGDGRHKAPPWYFKIDYLDGGPRHQIIVTSHRDAGRHRCRNAEERSTRRKILRETPPKQPWKLPL